VFGFPGYLRNLSYSGSPLGTLNTNDSTAGPRALDTNNSTLGARALVLNAVRDAAVNFATWDKYLNHWITNLVVRSLAAIGLDANAPDVTFPHTKFQLAPGQTDEDYAGNPLQLLLGATAILSILLGAGTPPTLARIYALCLLAGAFLFLVVLRWQPWITRLQLPLFALCAPLAAFLPIHRGRGRLLAILAVLLVMWALPPLFLNRTRPVLPLYGIAGSFWFKMPEQILFTKRPDLQWQYELAVSTIVKRGYRDVGLIISADDWEYPFWRLLRQASVKNLRIEHVGLTGPVAEIPYPLGAFSPTIVVTTSADRPQEMAIDGRVFRKELELPALAIYDEQR
jgi:hypothetical protein